MIPVLPTFTMEQRLLMMSQHATKQVYKIHVSAFGLSFFIIFYSSRLLVPSLSILWQTPHPMPSLRLDAL